MFSMITISLILMTLSIIVMMLAIILSKKTYSDREKSSPFECGFDSYLLLAYHFH